MIEILLTVTIISTTNLIFFIAGYWAAKGSLIEKVKEIIRAKHTEEVGGPVKSLTPEQLDKKKSREIYEKYMG